MRQAASVFILMLLAAVCLAQQNPTASESQKTTNDSAKFEAELQAGIKLTSHGDFAAAIPHLLNARGHVSDEYAASFDLALCLVASGQFKDAIPLLTGLVGGPHDENVYNLLAQAYVGDDQPQKAFDSLEKAAALAPTNEKIYLFVADACMDSQDYQLGLKVVDAGLQKLPQSAGLHYQRATFLAHLDKLDLAGKDFKLVGKLEPGSDIAYIAQAQEDLFTGNVSESIRIAREGIANHHQTAALLTILGQALFRSGLTPGQPDFAEAKAAFEKSVAARPNDAGAQIDLGKLYLMDNNLNDAIFHLEAARRIEPGNPSPYTNLAAAYRRRGDIKQAQQMLKILSDLNRRQEQRIAAAPGDSKSGYVTEGNADANAKVNNNESR
jgi:tetratricopeptide (TPR) repeat protein